MSDTSVDNVDVPTYEGELVEPAESITSRIITGVAVVTIGTAFTYGMYKWMEKRDARRAAKEAEEIHVVTDIEDQNSPS